jgi:hypothetical protein
MNLLGLRLLDWQLAQTVEESWAAQWKHRSRAVDPINAVRTNAGVPSAAAVRVEKD